MATVLKVPCFALLKFASSHLGKLAVACCPHPPGKGRPGWYNLGNRAPSKSLLSASASSIYISPYFWFVNYLWITTFCKRSKICVHVQGYQDVASYKEIRTNHSNLSALPCGFRLTGCQVAPRGFPNKVRSAWRLVPAPNPLRLRRGVEHPSPPPLSAPAVPPTPTAPPPLSRPDPPPPSLWRPLGGERRHRRPLSNLGMWHSKRYFKNSLSWGQATVLKGCRFPYKQMRKNPRSNPYEDILYVSSRFKQCCKALEQKG